MAGSDKYRCGEVAVVETKKLNQLEKVLKQVDKKTISACEQACTST